MTHTVALRGKVLFEPENVTKKHKAQAAWKVVAMVMIDDAEDVERYYRWFLEKRFNLKLNSTLRGVHITFINDHINDINEQNGTLEEKEQAWKRLKDKWDGKEITVVLNLRPFTDILHWWLIVDHKHRGELHNIRAEIGLGRPYFGLHMTFGNLAQNYLTDKKGEFVLDDKKEKIPIFNKELEHSKYIHLLNELGYIEINKDYINENPLEIKRINPDRVDLYNSDDELLGTLFNEYELNHIRIQIAKKALHGYYVIWKKHIRIDIESDGSIKTWPEGFYDIQENQLVELFTVKLANIKNEK